MTDTCILCLEDGAVQIPSPFGCECRFRIHEDCMVRCQSEFTKCLHCRKARTPIRNQTRITLLEILYAFFSSNTGDEYELFQDITIRFEALADNINNYNIERYYNQIDNTLINDSAIVPSGA